MILLRCFVTLLVYLMSDTQYSLKFNVHGSLHRKNILIYIQQDATLRSLFYLETALHVLDGTITHHQKRKLYLQHLVFVTPLLLPAAIAAGSSVRLHLVGYILEYSLKFV